jgi:hypothetical protein
MLRMTGRSALLLLGLLISLSSFAQDRPKPPISMNISVNSSTVNHSSPIDISIELTNNSNRGVSISSTALLCDYQVKVRDSQGKSVRLSELGRTIYEGAACSGDLIRYADFTLSPAQSEERVINVLQLYEIKSPGTYSIRVEKWLEDTNKNSPCADLRDRGANNRGDGRSQADELDYRQAGRGCTIKSNEIEVTVID